MHESTIIQRALLSVYDKSNIIELAEQLHLRGVELISTGNTAAILKEHGLPVTSVSEYTGFPEIMQGRLKTLHPKIHGGILGRRDLDADVMIANDIHDIDLIVVNLYPFQEVIKKADVSLAEAIENIDIGGPTMIRAAAKNHEWCTVLTSPADYPLIIEELEKNNGMVSSDMRFHFAAKAFAHTAAYDTTIAQFFKQKNSLAPTFDDPLLLQYSLKEVLRYGENPHQEGAFYLHKQGASDSIAHATQLQGKALSFNNIQDADTALECVKGFSQPACVIVKHANPCGVAIGDTLLAAYEKAYQGDPTSAFGGIVAFNEVVDEKLMQQILDKQFVEVILAPDFSPNAKKVGEQKPNTRLLQYVPDTNKANYYEIRSVTGGLLIQTHTQADLTSHFNIVTTVEPSPEQMQDLIFAWQVVKYVKSNAIVFAKNGQTLGIGAGQMSRIFSTHIAALKAEENQLALNNSVMASDAFFPFIDNVEKANLLGVKAIIQPGGSKRDNEVIACANELGIAMVFTGIRHFRH